MKKLYLLCDPGKALGFVNITLDAKLRRSQFHVLTKATDVLGLIGGLVVRGPGPTNAEVEDVLHYSSRLTVIGHTDPRVPGLIDEARKCN